MNRLDFFKEIKKGLVETFKEIALPLVEDDVKKLNTMLEDFSGYEWYPITLNIEHLKTGVTDFSLSGHLYYLYKTSTFTKVINSACPFCHTHLYYLSYNGQLKCMHCDETFSLPKSEDDVSILTTHPLTKRNESWCVGVKKG